MMMIRSFGSKRKAERDSAEADVTSPVRRRIEVPRHPLEQSRNDAKDLGAWNSSGQRPERNAAHNADIAANYPRGHLLNMPVSIQRRIFAKVQRQDEPLFISPTAVVAPEDKNNLAILEVCCSIRKEAVPLYFTINSFDLQIKNFEASAILRWWQRATMHRQNATALPILLAGGSEDSSDLWVQDGAPGELTQSMKDAKELLLDRLQRPELLLSTTAQFPRGNINLSVEYSPNWANLKEWLRLSHSGELPMLQYSDIKHSDIGISIKESLQNEESQAARMLRGVVEAFNIIEGYKGLDWATAEKSLAGVRGFLKRDSRDWGEDSANMTAIEQQYDGGDEQMDIDAGSDISFEHGNAEPVHGPFESDSEDQEFHINDAGNLEHILPPYQPLRKTSTKQLVQSSSLLNQVETQYHDPLSQCPTTQAKKHETKETDDEDDELGNLRLPTPGAKRGVWNGKFASPAQEAQSRVKKGRMNWPKK